MESISFSKTLCHSFPFLRPQFHSPRPLSIPPASHPLKPSSRKTLTLLCNSHRPPLPPSKISESVSSLLKPAVLSLTAAAAVFFSRNSLPSLASPLAHPPPSQSQTLPSSDESNEQILEEKLASYPEDVESLRALIQDKVKNQKLPEAIAIVDRLIVLDPRDLDLHLLKSHLYTYSGDTQKAKEGFEEVLKANPFVVEAFHGLVMAASHSRDADELSGIVGRVEEVMKLCENEERRAELRDLKLLVAQVRIIEGRYQEALTIYREMVKEEPRDFRPYLCQGIVYTLMKKMDEAAKKFEQYRKLVPKNHPFAQLFESNLNGINAAINRKPGTESVGSVLG